ncbi:MAG: hypothetical protein FLDDKLPJ_03591 [Phycisphaerae bacterium]|nr:hypothetical protein [Phycisphaerae bacterium]
MIRSPYNKITYACPFVGLMLAWGLSSAHGQLQTTTPTDPGDEGPQGCTEEGFVYPSCTWPDNGVGNGVRRFRGFEESTLQATRGMFVDPQGNVVIGGSQEINNGAGTEELIIIKYERDGDTAWQVSPGISTTHDYCKDVAIDLRGDVFVVEEFLENGHYKLGIIKLRGTNGSTVWSHVWPPSDEDYNVSIRRVVVDDEGSSYVLGVVDDTKLLAIKYGPAGDREWVLIHETQPGNFILGEQVDTDASGNVYAMTRNTTGDESAIVKITREGDLSPSWEDIGDGVGVRRFPDEFFTALAVQRSGRLILAGSEAPTSFPKVRVLNPDGTSDWSIRSNAGGTGYFNDVTTNETGEFAAVGRVDQDIITMKFNADGTRPWSENRRVWDGSGQYDEGFAVVMDRLGNVYSAGTTTTSTSNSKWVLIKYETETGDPVWSDLPNGAFQQEFDAGARDGVRYASIDGGGQLYLGGYVGRNVNQYYDTSVMKLGQPFLSAPEQLISSDVRLETTDQSIWGPGQGNREAEFTIFNEGFRVDEHPGGSEAGFGGGLDIEINNGGSGDATIGLNLYAIADGGSVDASLPFNAAFFAPGREEIINGKPVTVVTTFTRDPAGSVAISPTTLEAGINVHGNVDILFHMWLEAFGEIILQWDVINFLLSFDVDLITTSDILAQFGVGEFDLPGGLGGGEYQIPQIAPRGSMDANNEAHLQGDDPFLSMRADITNFVTQKFGYPTVFSEGIDLAGLGSAEVEAGIAQVYLEGDFSLDQEFDFTPGAPRVRFTFTDGIPAQEIDLGAQLTFTMPADANVTVTPTFKVRSGNNWTTTTSITFRPEVGFDGIYGSAFAEAFDITLLDRGFCFGCFPYSPGQLAAQLARDTFRLGGFQDIQGTPFTIIGRVATAPELIASTMSGADVYLFDQASVVEDYNAVSADFNEFVSGTTPMILFGLDFLASANPKAHFTIHGKSEQLVTTRLSNNELLVELPNKFRLLSGTGRFQVKSSRGNSNTLDFVVRNPYPNVVTVGPNLWAADPDFTDLLITVVDGKTSAGTDSYISRSDYYFQLQQLWLDSSLPGTIEGTFTQVDFNGLPPMPKMLWNDEALTPYGEPLDSGLLWAQLPRDYYGSPLNVEVAVVSPGPGGGTSDSVSLTVAAPRPQVTDISPDVVPPGTDDLRMVIRGPVHVDNWEDRGVTDPFIEQERRSNFNRASVVLWDGSANGIETRFISSSHLVAIIPASKLESGGTHFVSVQTPSNGTFYFDHNAGAQVTSGGISNRVRFQVKYPRPEILDVSPAELATSSLNYNEGERTYDLALKGVNFSNTTTVYWNGSARTTLFESPEVLQVKLLPADVENPGENYVYAITPGPGGGRTDEVMVPVIFDGDHAAPTLTQLVPNSARRGSGDTIVTVDGAGFYFGTRVYWNDEIPMLYSRYISPTRMEVTIPAEKLAIAGSFPITVINAPPGGGESNALIFTVVP